MANNKTAKNTQQTKSQDLMTLQEKFDKQIAPAFMQEFGIKNIMAVPRPVKVVLNIGVGAESKDASALEEIASALTNLAGQKAVFTKAKKAVAGFNIRKGDVIGIKVTLRHNKMWGFLDKLINIVLPRTKDFKGIDPNKFDKAGNYTFGLVEYLVFTEVDPVKINKVKGLSITITFRNSNPKYSRYLMEKMGFVFKNNK